MFKGFSVLLKSFFDFLKYPIYLFIGLFALFGFICTIFILVKLFKGERIKKGSRRILKAPSMLKRIFYLTPKQFVDDIFNKPADFFNPDGLVIFEGRQGAGKTISMVKYIQDLQYEYPKCKVITNLKYKYENDVLHHWKQLIDYNNDIYGVVVSIDELQNWFSCNDSKNFPPEMLQVITQNRKNRRIILGTSQNFYLLSKAIRSQATEVRRCSTLFGCLTIVRRTEPILDSEGNVVEFRKKGMYFFVHDKKLRDSYDTYKVIERLSNSGFQENTNIDVVNSNIYKIDKNLLKKLK